MLSSLQFQEKFKCLFLYTPKSEVHSMKYNLWGAYAHALILPEKFVKISLYFRS